MLIAALVFLGAKPEIAAIESRFRHWCEKHPRFEVKFTVRLTVDEPPGRGSWVVDRPTRQRFTVAYGDLEFELRQSPIGALEIEHSEKTFRYLIGSESLVGAEGFDSLLGEDTYPWPIFSKSLSGLLAPSEEFVLTPAETVAGQKCDAMVGGADRVKVWVDDAGRLRRLRLAPDLSTGRAGVTLEYTEYGPLPASFTVDPFPPVGYEAHEVPVPDNWFAPDDDLSHLLGSRRARATLVIATSDDDPAGAPDWLVKVATAAERLGAVVFEVPFGRRALGTRGRIAPDRRWELRLRSQGTPLLILADGEGRVRHSWLGYQRSQAQAVLDDLSGRIEDLLGLPNRANDRQRN